MAAEVSLCQRHQIIKGTRRSGRERELLAMASEKRQEMGDRRILGLAAGGGRETSLPLLHHPEMFRD